MPTYLLELRRGSSYGKSTVGIKTLHKVGSLEIAPEIVIYLEIKILKIYFQDVYAS